MPHVELDTDKIQGINLHNVSDIEALMVQAEEEAITEVTEEDASLTLGGIGSPYMIGPIDCTIAMGNIVLLNEINSPFITGEIGEEGEELDTVMCIKSLYVLAEGKKAVKSVMAVKQRIQAMMMLRPMVNGNPALFDKLMDRVESISQAEVEFEERALDWYSEHFVGYDFQEVIDSVFMAMADLMKIADDLPSEEGSKKK